jgi:hypothetical protein
LTIASSGNTGKCKDIGFSLVASLGSSGPVTSIDFAGFLLGSSLVEFANSLLNIVIGVISNPLENILLH